MKSFTALPSSVRSFSFCMVAVMSLPGSRILDEKLLYAFGEIYAIGCIDYTSEVVWVVRCLGLNDG